jgi:hypothetical protein
MYYWWLGTFAAASIAAAAYAQYRIERYTAGTAKIWLTRVVLIAIGIALGYVLATSDPHTHGAAAVFLFLIGLGLVHFPAAFILMVKRGRGSGKS